MTRFTLGSAPQGVREIWFSTYNGVRTTPAQRGPSSVPGLDDFWQSSSVQRAMSFPNKPTSIVDGFIQRFDTGQALILYSESGRLTEVVYLAGIDRGWFEIDARP